MSKKKDTYMVLREISVKYTGREVKLDFSGVADSPDACVKAFDSVVGLDSVNEHLLALYLGPDLRPIGYHITSIGNQNSAIIDPKIVTKSAIDLMAHGVVLVHNHPSGNIQFSGEDTNAAQSIKEALGLFRIVLHDFLIVDTQGKRRSMREEGEI